MYSQQHTIPMTGEGGGDDHSSGSTWSCTQPTTSQTKRSKGFLQRLSQRPCTMKAVPSTETVPEEEEVIEEKNTIKPWGSSDNILGLMPSSMPRSPSLPILNTTSSSKLLCGSHYTTRLLGTPKQGSMQGKSLNFTPQKQSDMNTPSINLTKFARALHSKVEHTPQHGSNKMASAQRAPLQAIMPQQPSTILPNETLKQRITLTDKENVIRSSTQELSSTKLNTKDSVPDWKKELMEEWLQSSPRPQDNTPAKRVFQPVAVRTLFDPTPKKHQHETPKVTPESVLKQETRDAELNHIYAEIGPASVQDSVPLPTAPNDSRGTPRPSQPYSANRPDIEVRQISMEQRQVDYKFKHPPPKETGSQELIVNRIAYTIEQRLGRGGSSEVFQVTRQTDNQVMAIKCVDLRSVDDGIRTSYLNEISLLKRMQGSPRVVQLIDFELCDARQMLFVVMEKGARDLASFLKERSRRKDLRLGTVEAFWRDMVEAVAAIHERGIIHSDLKPANFLLVGEVGFHQLKLIDFGIASSLQSDMTSVVRETPAGTLNYMSPEAVRGMQGQHCPAKINYKSDIWSLGCILYNLLYGRTPFQHVTHPGLKAEAICNPRHVIEFPSRSPILPGDGCVPLPLLRTVQACLSRDTATRPSAKQLLAIKYCGCEETSASNIDTFLLGLVSLFQNHPCGGEMTHRLVAMLQANGKQEPHQ